MRKAAQRIGAAQSLTSDKPPCPAAAEGLGGLTPVAPRTLNPGAALPTEISKALSRSVQDDTTDATHTFKEKVTFGQDQPRLVKIIYTGSTMLRPGEVGVVVDTIVKNDVQYKRVTNTSSTFSLEYIINGDELLNTTDSEGYGSFDSPYDALYNPAWTPVVGETWGPSASDGRLQRGFPGFRIEGSAVNGKVRVVKEEFPILTGLPDAAILGTATGTVSIYSRDSSSDITGLSDTTWNVTAVSRFPVVPQGAVCEVSRINGVWTITGLLGFQPAFLGKTEEAIASGATGTVGVWSGAAGSEGDLGIDLECHNKWEDVASGAWVWIGYNNAVYYIVKAPAAEAEAAWPEAIWGGIYGGTGTFSSAAADKYTAFAFDLAASNGVTPDAANNEVEIDENGVYQVSFRTSILADSAGDTVDNLDFNLYKNGTLFGQPCSLALGAQEGAYLAGSFSAPAILAAGDVIDVRVNTSSNTIRYARSALTVTKVGV
jgi:hypothetical protein